MSKQRHYRARALRCYHCGGTDHLKLKVGTAVRKKGDVHRRLMECKTCGNLWWSVHPDVDPMYHRALEDAGQQTIPTGRTDQ